MKTIDSNSTDLVSVIIPCYKQAHFLGEAIESVLKQSYPCVEIIVIDDGSPDETAQVAARYAEVRCVRQPNMGLAAARNTGIRQSRGSYLVFLDADDRLLPDALATNLGYLRSRPECAYVAGVATDIDSIGEALPFTMQPRAETNHYYELLQRNVTSWIMAVLFRRSVFEIVGDFDTSLKSSEDYDIYFRITRRFPIYYHNNIVAEYRQHAMNMSRFSAQMLQSTMIVMRSQWKYVRGNKQYEHAYKKGMEYWKNTYGNDVVNEIRFNIRARNWKQAALDARTLLRYNPPSVMNHIFRKTYCVVFRIKSDLDDLDTDGVPTRNTLHE